MKDLLGRGCWRLRQRAVDWGLRGGHRDYARFIILGEGRSGSNFLRGLLNAHPHIVAFGELFRSEDAIGWEFPDYERYLSTPRLVARSQDPPEFLESEVFRGFRGGIAAVGFKIFYYHADRGPRQAVWPYLESDRGLKVIHIKRWNTLRSFLSLQKAFLTDRWTEPDHAPPDTLSVVLDPDECRRRFELAEETKERFDARFRHHRRIDVVYEDLARSHEREMAHVQDFLGVSRRPVQPRTHKQAALPLAQAITNYAELKRTFADTRWAAFFEE